ncbi:MAG: hydroxymethylbilane synthase [Acidobacteriota bacterium]
MRAEALTIGTRGSDLALTQTSEVARRIQTHHPGIRVDLRVIRTTGDRELGARLARIGGKGLFTKELEDALLRQEVDLAVHSLKDLPTRMPEGLALAAVVEREDPRDALVAAPGITLRQLPAGARIGTSSLRRRAQLLARYPNVAVLDVRGNVPTRLARLDRGDFDALVLARAGLARLGLLDRVAEVLDADEMVPAVGQGALAVQARAGDARVLDALSALDHEPTRLATAAERALLARLEGGCQVPIGALGTWRDGSLRLDAVVADLDGSTIVRGQEASRVRTESDACSLGARLAERLLDQGAAGILERVRAAGGEVSRGGVP